MKYRSFWLNHGRPWADHPRTRTIGLAPNPCRGKLFTVKNLSQLAPLVVFAMSLAYSMRIYMWQLSSVYFGKVSIMNGLVENYLYDMLHMLEPIGDGQ